MSRRNYFKREADAPIANDSNSLSWILEPRTRARTQKALPPRGALPSSPCPVPATPLLLPLPPPNLVFLPLASSNSWQCLARGLWTLGRDSNWWDESFHRRTIKETGEWHPAKSGDCLVTCRHQLRSARVYAPQKGHQPGTTPGSGIFIYVSRWETGQQMPNRGPIWKARQRNWNPLVEPWESLALFCHETPVLEGRKKTMRSSLKVKP